MTLQEDQRTCAHFRSWQCSSVFSPQLGQNQLAWDKPCHHHTSTSLGLIDFNIFLLAWLTSTLTAWLGVKCFENQVTRFLPISLNIKGEFSVFLIGLIAAGFCKFDILFLQETWAQDPISVSLRRFKTFAMPAIKTYSREKRSGGLAILFSVDLKVETLNIVLVPTTYK